MVRKPHQVRAALCDYSKVMCIFSCANSMTQKLLSSFFAEKSCQALFEVKTLADKIARPTVRIDLVNRAVHKW